MLIIQETPLGGIIIRGEGDIVCLKCYNKVNQALSYFAFEVTVFYIKYAALWAGGF